MVRPENHSDGRRLRFSLTLPYVRVSVPQPIELLRIFTIFGKNTNNIVATWLYDGDQRTRDQTCHTVHVGRQPSLLIKSCKQHYFYFQGNPSLIRQTQPHLFFLMHDYMFRCVKTIISLPLYTIITYKITFIANNYKQARGKIS